MDTRPTLTFEGQAAKDKEYQRQQRVHAHRVCAARRRKLRKITKRSRKANR